MTWRYGGMLSDHISRSSRNSQFTEEAGSVAYKLGAAVIKAQKSCSEIPVVIRLPAANRHCDGGAVASCIRSSNSRRYPIAGWSLVHLITPK